MKIITKGIHIHLNQLSELKIINIARKINDLLKQELDEDRFDLKFANW